MFAATFVPVNTMVYHGNDDNKENHKPLALTPSQHKHELSLPLKKRRALCELNGQQQFEQAVNIEHNRAIVTVHKPTPTYATVLPAAAPTDIDLPSQHEMFACSSLFHMSPMTRECII